MGRLQIIILEDYKWLYQALMFLWDIWQLLLGYWMLQRQSGDTVHTSEFSTNLHTSEFSTNNKQRKEGERQPSGLIHVKECSESN